MIFDQMVFGPNGFWSNYFWSNSIPSIRWSSLRMMIAAQEVLNLQSDWLTNRQTDRQTNRSVKFAIRFLRKKIFVFHSLQVAVEIQVSKNCPRMCIRPSNPELWVLIELIFVLFGNRFNWYQIKSDTQSDRQKERQTDRQRDRKTERKKWNLSII